MVKMRMSRDARQILDTLQSLSNKEASVEDVFIAEELAYSFYGKTVSSHIKRMYNPNSKNNPDSMAFYVKPTRSLNKGRRNKDDWYMTKEEREIYCMVCGEYLIDDFNYEQLKQLREVCQRPHEDVEEAIKISVEEDVRSIPYLYRVLEGLEARREHQRRQIEERRKLFLQESNRPVVRRSRLEIASLMYDWQETIQNVELQSKVNDLLRRNSDEHDS